MKKILLVISLISILLLTGCNLNDNESINDDYEELKQEISKKDETIKELQTQISELQNSSMNEIEKDEDSIGNNNFEKIDYFDNYDGALNLRRYLGNLSYDDTLSDCGYEISSDGKTMKRGTYIYTTNLNKKVKSFKVGGSVCSPFFLVLTEEGELYLQDTVGPLEIVGNNFKLFGSGYDGICTLQYSRGDSELVPFVARATETWDDFGDSEISFNDYTMFMDSENKIVFYEHRP